MRFRPRTRTDRRPGARPARLLLALTAGALAALPAGCTPAGSEPSVPRTPREVAVPDYLQDMVGEIARFAGREPLLVQGYGFVTGLDGTGTTTVPPGMRRRVLDMMRRKRVEDPERILASSGTAVVTVFGQVPPGARKGERFDLGVRVVPGTETTSLEGGYVLECDLHRVRVGRGVETGTEPVAIGEGSIFVSPFVEEGETEASGGTRQGRILAGGRMRTDRRFSLVLLTPSVRTADQVVRFVNARFPDAAKGTRDPVRIDLAVPRAFRDDKTRFLDLVGALYMRETPAARDRRIERLLQTLRRHEDMDRVALCLEAFGASVAPSLYALGESKDPAVRFYAGRTLAHLQDARAVHVLEPLVSGQSEAYQEQAVRALGRLRSGLGLGVLGRALHVENVRVRLAAWQAMTRLVPETFRVRAFEGKFALHVVATEAPPFIYVARTGRPEIALFGRVEILPPILAETRRVTATARQGQKRLRLIARRHDRDIHLEADLAVRDLLETMAGPIHGDEDDPTAVTGLGLGYSDVVGLLHEMDRKGALAGPLVLQPLEYRLLKPRPEGRPVRPPDRKAAGFTPADERP